MKKYFMIMSLLVSVTSFAETECPVKFGTDNYVEQVKATIESKLSCIEASEITKACAMGSSMDAQFVDSALKQCSSRIDQVTSIKDAVNSANLLCAKKYSQSEGTLAISMRAFCQLEVAMLYDNLLAPVEL